MSAPTRHTSKECHRCHRLGHEQFVPWGSEGWECSNDRACRGRVERAAGVNLTVRQRSALELALIYKGRFNVVHRTTRDALVKKGLAEFRSGHGFVLTDAGRAAASGAR